MQPWPDMHYANDALNLLACNQARSDGHIKLESSATPSAGQTDLNCRPVWTMLAQLFYE